MSEARALLCAVMGPHFMGLQRGFSAEAAAGRGPSTVSINPLSFAFSETFIVLDIYLHAGEIADASGGIADARGNLKSSQFSCENFRHSMWCVVSMLASALVLWERSVVLCMCCVLLWWPISCMGPSIII